MATSGLTIRYITDSRLDDILDNAFEKVIAKDYFGAFSSMLEGVIVSYHQGIPDGQYNYNTEEGQYDYYEEELETEGTSELFDTVVDTVENEEVSILMIEERLEELENKVTEFEARIAELEGK